MHISPLLTDILARHHVASLTPRCKPVDFVVDLQTSDAAGEAGVQPQDVGHVLDVAHPAQVESLIEGDS